MIRDGLYDDVGGGQRIFVRDGEMNARDVAARRQGGKAGRRASGQTEGGLSRWQVDDTHITPKDPVTQTGAQCLCASLLGGESLGVGRAPTGPSIRLALFDWREATLDKASPECRERFLDPANVTEIVADAQDHAGSVVAWLRWRLPGFEGGIAASSGGRASGA